MVVIIIPDKVKSLRIYKIQKVSISIDGTAPRFKTPEAAYRLASMEPLRGSKHQRRYTG
jgi:hypothetical protein